MTTSAGKNGDRVERKSDKVEKGGFWTKYLVNKKTFVLLFGLSGCFLSSTFSYFNGTITTMEKRFKMASKTTGTILFVAFNLKLHVDRFILLLLIYFCNVIYVHIFAPQSKLHSKL